MSPCKHIGLKINPGLSEQEMIRVYDLVYNGKLQAPKYMKGRRLDTGPHGNQLIEVIEEPKDDSDKFSDDSGEVFNGQKPVSLSRTFPKKLSKAQISKKLMKMESTTGKLYDSIQSNAPKFYDSIKTNVTNKSSNKNVAQKMKETSRTVMFAAESSREVTKENEESDEFSKSENEDQVDNLTDSVMGQTITGAG